MSGYVATATPGSRTAPSQLSGAVLDLGVLRERGRQELRDIFQAARGRKALVLDTELRGLLFHIVPEGTKFLKQHGVVHLCALHTELRFPTPEGREEDPDYVLYFVRPSLDNMRHVCSQIRKRNAKRRPVDPVHRYKLYYVPHRTFICEQVLEDEGIRSQIELGECQLDMFPLEPDLLSLELEQSFKECYIDEDTTMLTTVARSLVKLESLYGCIPYVKAKGSAASTALHRYLKLRRKAYDPRQLPKQSQIDTLVVFDRAIDMITPLLTPLTYEGFIDEFYGIQHGAIKVLPGEIGEAGQKGHEARIVGASPKELTTIALNSNDPLYGEIRDMHLDVLGVTLNGRAVEMQQTYARVKEETRDGSLNDIHDVVKSIPVLQQKYRGLNLHIELAGRVQASTNSSRFQQRWQVERAILDSESRYDDIEDMIASCEELSHVVRLLCLQSLTAGGMKASRYENLRRELIQSYGYRHVFTLNNLEQIGLLRKSDLSVFYNSGGSWPSMKRLFRLLKENVNTKEPDDIAYVGSGYAPLTVRLLQMLIKPGWTGIPDLLRLVAGPTLEFCQRPEPSVENERIVAANVPSASQIVNTPTACAPIAANAFNKAPGLPLEGQSSSTGQKVMLVYFIGGVTFMEIAALRFLSHQSDFPYTILVCTTKLTNGNGLIQSAVQKFPSRLKKDLETVVALSSPRPEPSSLGFRLRRGNFR